MLIIKTKSKRFLGPYECFLVFPGWKARNKCAESIAFVGFDNNKAIMIFNRLSHVGLLILNKFKSIFKHSFDVVAVFG